jgi:hypothetical protein
MNYIKQLESENRRLKGDLASVNADLQCLFEYLNSPKFRSSHEMEHYVNVADVLNRLQDARMTVAGR